MKIQLKIIDNSQIIFEQDEPKTLKIECTNCNKILPITEFYNNPTGKNSVERLGKHYYCKSCTKLKQKILREKKLQKQIGNYWMFHYRSSNYKNIWPAFPGFGDFENPSLYLNYPKLPASLLTYFLPVQPKQLHFYINFFNKTFNPSPNLIDRKLIKENILMWNEWGIQWRNLLPYLPCDTCKEIKKTYLEDPYKVIIEHEAYRKHQRIITTPFNFAPSHNSRTGWNSTCLTCNGYRVSVVSTNSPYIPSNNQTTVLESADQPILNEEDTPWNDILGD